MTKQDISGAIKIIDIAEEFALSLEPVSSGNFDYRCKCPSPDHKSGNERTGSLYIDNVNNNYYCFGCNSNRSVIDFYMLCTGMQFSDAMRELQNRAISAGAKQGVTSIDIRLNNTKILLQTSMMLRECMLQHHYDLRWINSVMMAVDKKYESLKSDDIDLAKKIHLSVKKAIANRYGK